MKLKFLFYFFRSLGREEWRKRKVLLGRIFFAQIDEELHQRADPFVFVVPTDSSDGGIFHRDFDFF